MLSSPYPPSSRSIPFGPLVAARRDECPMNTGYETVFGARDEGGKTPPRAKLILLHSVASPC
jgi:hypothetical protein